MFNFDKNRYNFYIKIYFTNRNMTYAHALGGVSGVASFITTDEQLQ